MTPPDDTATIERDLTAVDAALGSGAAEHESRAARELQELALALQAEAPEPDPAFARKLGERVRGGFARERAARRKWGRPWLLPSLAAATTVVILAIAVNQLTGPGAGVLSGGSDDEGGSVAAPSTAGREALSESGGGGDDSGSTAQDESATVAPTPPNGGFAPGQTQRRIERSIGMTLVAPDREIGRVAGEVTRVTGRHGGFVLSSDLNTGDDGASGSFELRIPSERLQPALRDLSELATVRSQTQSGRDVTREHVTAVDRLQAARAERRSLLRRLEEADTDEEAEALRRRLDLVAGEINGLRGQLRDLRLRTNYAVVSVDLVGEEDEGGGGASGSFDDAMGDAGDLLVGMAGVLVRALALALPLGVIAGLAWLVARAYRRRRRESALA